MQPPVIDGVWIIQGDDGGVAAAESAGAKAVAALTKGRNSPYVSI